jgi:hypothetical protein
MMLKPNNRPHKGRAQLNVAPQKSTTGAHASESGAACFAVIEASCIVNSLPKVRQLIKTSIWQF